MDPRGAPLSESVHLVVFAKLAGHLTQLTDTPAVQAFQLGRHPVDGGVGVLGVLGDYPGTVAALLAAGAPTQHAPPTGDDESTS